MFLDLLSQFVVAVLTGFLALSTLASSALKSHLPPPPNSAIAIATETPMDEEETLASLPSHYEYGGAIPDILIKNASFQQAAVGLSDDTLSASTSTLTAAERINASLVNIYCTYTTEKFERTTAGTGFFISNNGIILTNAHVAQYLILEDEQGTGSTDCVIRGGSPATPLFKAELLYISPLWINNYANLILAESPKGTGERDYALLYVSESLTGNEVPTSFTHLTLDTNLLPRSTEGEPVIVGGYPAEKFFTEGKDAELHPVVAESDIHSLYTFGSNYADIFSISESTVGEHGASGGPATNVGGAVIGLIVTKGNLETEGPRSLRAITLSYIDRTIKEETGLSLSENLRGNIPARAKIFRDALVPFLSTILERELQ